MERLALRVVFALGIGAFIHVVSCDDGGGDSGKNSSSSTDPSETDQGSEDGDGKNSDEEDGESGSGEDVNEGTGSGEGVDTGSDGNADSETPDHDRNRPEDASQNVGDYCYVNIQCKSEFCVSYRQVTPDPEGHCEESSTPDRIVAIGTTLDFETRQAIPDATIKMYGATNFTLMRCNAVASDTLKTDVDGRFKKAISPPPVEPVGFVALAQKGSDYANSVSGVADPPWPNGFIRHDILMVKQSTLDKWSELLSADSEMKPYMNLSANGGAVGAILDVDSGKPIVGAQIVPASGGSTKAKIRYLDSVGEGFVKDGITESGIFVLVNPALAEKFDVFLDGKKVNITTAKFGDVKCAVFIVDIPIEADEKGIEL